MATAADRIANNLNFGALSSNKKQDVKSVKEQELKKIIEKYV